MRRLMAVTAFILSTLSSGIAFGQAGHGSKYAGQEQREIKSLSREDLSELRIGGGWGFAKAAELNGVPGPAHLLELKDRIPLSSAQITKVSAIYEDMKARAVSQGERLIELERQLESFFRTKATSDTRLRAQLAEIAEVRGRLRYTHLSTHLAVSAFLTEMQIARYNALRGYDGDSPSGASHGKRHHDSN
jgi:hypothetical protein